MARYIDADALMEKLSRMIDYCQKDNKVNGLTALFQVGDAIMDCPTADVVEVEKVAEMLRTMFDDDSACNYNGNDEWLPMKCKYAETDCPMPKERLGCWKEFVKHFLAKMDVGKS